MFALKITSQHATAAYATLKYAGLLLSCHLLISVVYAGEATPRLNDTGIQYGGDYPQGTHTDCTAKITSFNVSQDQAESFIQQQDCSTGLSANTQQAASVFSYQKIGASGEKLPPEAAEWDCVTDEVSGLMWEVKRDIPDHQNSVSDRITWYHSKPTKNGPKAKILIVCQRRAFGRRFVRSNAPRPEWVSAFSRQRQFTFSLVDEGI